MKRIKKILGCSILAAAAVLFLALNSFAADPLPLWTSPYFDNLQLVHNGVGYNYPVSAYNAVENTLRTGSGLSARSYGIGPTIVFEFTNSSSGNLTLRLIGSGGSVVMSNTYVLIMDCSKPFVTNIYAKMYNSKKNIGSNVYDDQSFFWTSSSRTLQATNSLNINAVSLMGSNSVNGSNDASSSILCSFSFDTGSFTLSPGSTVQLFFYGCDYNQYLSQTQIGSVCGSDVAATVYPAEITVEGITFDSIGSFLENSVGGFFNMQIFPGFSLGGLYGTLAGVLLFIIFLKMFAGG